MQPFTHTQIRSGNKINISHFNRVSSLRELNKSSHLVMQQSCGDLESELKAEKTFMSTERSAVVPKPSSLKKQEVFKSAPRASSFLD